MALSTSPEQLQRHCNAFQNDASPVGMVSTIHDEDHYLAETHHKPERNSAHPWSLKDLLDALISSLIINSHQEKHFQKDPKRYNYIYIYIYISHPNLNRVIHQSCPETVCKHSEATNFILFCNACNACRNVCRYVYPSYRHSLWISSWSDWVCLNMGYTEYTIGETP
jgi:hypothetical protein